MATEQEEIQVAVHRSVKIADVNGGAGYELVNINDEVSIRKLSTTGRRVAVTYDALERAVKALAG